MINIGAVQNAVSECDEALQSNPRGIKLRRDATYHTRGAAKVGLGDHNGAIEDFNESIQLNPKEGTILSRPWIGKGSTWAA